ncbi:MAG TPA: ABC transporter permease [Edaphobacter sp.]|nr:ABC transporter permease [Edaphobacter sp.]
MSLFGESGRRVSMLFRRRQFDADLEEEMRLHLDLREQEHMQNGFTQTEARSVARRRFGNPTALKERSHMTWGWQWLEDLMHDVKYGVRSMLRSPGITIVALLSLALGIGANTAIFSLIDAVMLRSLPVKDPGQLVLMGDESWRGNSDAFALTQLYSYPFYREMRKKNAVFSQTAAISSSTFRVHGFIEGQRDAEPMSIQLVSGTYFPLLGVHAARGRTLEQSDDEVKDGSPVAVVSYSWWKRAMALDPLVLNKKLKLGDTLFSIVGVAPPEFFGTTVGSAPDIWVPLSMQKEIPSHWDGYNQNFAQSLYLIGRLKPGVTLAQATTNVNLLYQQITRSFPDAPLSQENRTQLQRTHVELSPMARGLSSLRRQFSESLQVLMGVVALVLLIACANIANLLLARSTARAKEFAVRQALGARRSRLIRQLLTESLVLALVGGALGIGFATVASHLLLRMISSGPQAVPLDTSINMQLLLFTLAVTVLTALLFGTIPAFRATKLELTDSLKDGRSGNASTKNPLARVLIVTQVALSLVLMVGAGLFLHSLVNLNNVDTGFNKENVLRLQTDASSVGYKTDDARLHNLYNQIEDRVSALPGVRSASYSLFTYNEGSWNTGVAVHGQPIDDNINVKHNIIGNRYFTTMQIPLLTGRIFGTQDTATSKKVAIISESMARQLFPGGSPIGRTYGTGDSTHDTDIEVVGVVKDVKFGSLQEKTQFVDYFPAAQRQFYLNDLEVRYTGSFDAVLGEVRQAIRQIDPNLPLSNATTLDEQVSRSIANQRVVAQLSAFFGALAVFLSCIGIYGLMSYVVTRRTNEIGIRMALGAERTQVRWMIMREILVLVAIGIAIGIPAVLATNRLISNMLFGLKGSDPLTLFAAVAMLLAVAAIAGYLPSQRASRIEPMVALRYE